MSEKSDKRSKSKKAATHSQAPAESTDKTGAPDRGQRRKSGNKIAEIRELLGDKTVLLPVNRGQKIPADTGWQNTKAEVMADQAYLGRLNSGNVGVLLGAASGGLCSIDIDVDDAVEPFLAANPTFRGSLRSRGARGQQIWVKVTGDYPSLTKIKTVDGAEWGEWRADGGQSVIAGVHPDGMDYTILHRAKPVEIKFGDISWPDRLKLPWLKTDFEMLVEDNGQPFTVSKTGTVALNQMFFVRKYALEHIVQYDSGLAEFFEYDPATGLWQKMSVEAIKRQFHEDLGAVAKETGQAGVFTKRNDATATALVGLLKSMVQCRDVFAERIPAIHVKNGMIVSEGEQIVLKTVHPDFRSRNMCPFEYDASAECPRFRQELLGSALDMEDRKLLQKWAGSVLLGRNSAQRILLLTGTAGGGKSTVMTILERTIGMANVAQLRADHLSQRFEVFGFSGKTLLSGKDVAADFLMQKGAHVLKALVGGDLMEAEKKGFNQRVQLRGDFNVGVTCNTDLNIKLEGDTDAWRRRLIVIRYQKEPPKVRVADFADQLMKTEGPGILKWMVDGAIEYLDDIAECGDIKLTDKQKDRVERLLNQSDSLRGFVRTGVVKSDGDDVTVNELLASYYAWCEQRSWNPLSGSSISAQLGSAMLETHRSALRHDIFRDGKNARGFKNVRITGL